MKERMQQMMEALGMDPLGDTGPGLSFGGPGRSQKQLHHQTRDYRNTMVVKKAPSAGKSAASPGKMYFGFSASTFSGAWAFGGKKIGFHLSENQKEIRRFGFNTEEEWILPPSPLSTKGLFIGGFIASGGRVKEFSGSKHVTTTNSLNSMVFGTSKTFDVRTGVTERFIGVDLSFSLAVPWFGFELNYSCGYKFYTK